MKAKLTWFMVLLAFCMSFIPSCELFEKDKEDLYLIELGADVPDWDYLAAARDGSYMLIKESGGRPTMIYFVPEKGDDGYPIFFDNEGFPSMAYIQDHFFLFSRSGDHHVDIAMVTPDGEIVITREIETGEDWSDLAAKLDEALKSGWGSTILRWGGRAASVVGCGLSVKAAVATGGAAIPLAKWGCGSMVVSFAAQAVDVEAIGLSADGVGVVTGLIGAPGDPAGAIISIGSFAAGQAADAMDRRSQRADAIRAADGALRSGHGDVQVTLTWNNVADIDLHVVDPDGFEIYFARRTSPSGGQLDYDNTHAYGPENIFWPPGGAPQGTYRVYVNHYSGPNPSVYTVVVNAFGRIATFSGTVNVRQKVHVTDFSHTGIGKGSEGVVFESLEAPAVKAGNSP